MENYILFVIVLSFIAYYGYKTWKVYQPKKTLSCMEIDALRKAIVEKQKIKMIDVRSEGEFAEFHVPSAINIPLEDLKKGLKKISKDTKIVILCLKGSERSQEGAIIVAKMGFESTWLCGGTNEWFGTNNECLIC